MLLTDQDPTQTCSVALVSDPAELEKKRNAQEDIFQDGDGPGRRGPDAIVIGHYQLQTQLGKGSTGVVWKAVDLGPVRREVALKILHADYQDEHARIRFTNEVRALACLDDPHIAKVWDNGQTKDGRLFLAMELVSGQTLTKYCDTWSLTVAERIELVIKICQGIQHAHQRTILHRDLKPANILVALVDGQPIPKIIDFGLAKSTEGPLAPTAIETTQRGCLIGTIGYMSPEQAELDQRDVDVRSDVYALGAILYELLTGTLPIQREELHRHSLTDALKLIREKEPDRPSARVVQEPSASLHAARCRLSEVALAHALQGDVDAILLKALAKDRFQRYQSASEFAEDLQRYLGGGVVQARQRTYGYLAQKLLRRHWRAATVLATVLAMILTSWGITLGAYFVAAEERDKAKKEKELAILARNREVAANTDTTIALQFLKDVFVKVRPNEVGAQATMLEALDSSSGRLAELDSNPRVACKVRSALAHAYLRLARPETALRLLEPVLATHLITDEDQVNFVAPVHALHLDILLELERYEAALQAGRRFLSDYPTDGDKDYRLMHKDVQANIALALAKLGRFQEARDLLQGLIRNGLEGANGQIAINSHQASAAWGWRIRLLDLHLEWSLSDPSKFEDAQRLARQYLSIADTHPSATWRAMFQFTVKLKIVHMLRIAKKYDEALALIEELSNELTNQPDIVSQEPNTRTILDIARAQTLVHRGDTQQAESLCQTALATCRQHFGPNHDATQSALQACIEVQLAQHHYWKALTLYGNVEALATPKEGDLSKAERLARREFADLFAKATAQLALRSLR